jgi:hypothetical protein
MGKGTRDCTVSRTHCYNQSINHDGEDSMVKQRPSTSSTKTARRTLKKKVAREPPSPNGVICGDLLIIYSDGRPEPYLVTDVTRVWANGRWDVSVTKTKITNIQGEEIPDKRRRLLTDQGWL